MAVKARRSSTIALSLAALLGEACNVYEGSYLPPEDPPDMGDPACVAGSAILPPRPAPDTGVSVPTVTFALKEPFLDQTIAGENIGATIGINIDRVCTDVPSLQTRCRPPGTAFVPPSDGEMGIDNAFGTELFPTIRLIDPTLQTTSTASSEIGLGVVMVELAEWNGLDNDSQVHVIVSQGVAGTAPLSNGDCPVLGTDFIINTAMNYRTEYPVGHPMAGTQYPLPEWNPDNPDCFWVRSENFTNDDRTRPDIEDDNAYVSNRYLVASLGDNKPIVFSSSMNGVIVRLTKMAAFGQISPDVRRIDPVTVVGAWPLNSLYQTAEALGICTTSSFFPILENIVDRFADVRSDPVGTAVGSDLDCDALSVGVTFQGYLGKIAGLTPGPPVPDLCP